ncbi:radical SAM protein [Anaerococcus tetradius]|uniref:radical SAM protein n=1 Tax=Anaerococcus tetradius TaxID=33036 RepID=UPI0023F2F19C|nr:radical SAM protein [Anaerococcus tetradius]
MGLTIKWDITYACNLYCKHCINGQYLNKNDNSININEFKNIINDISENIKIDYIHFLGGEPTVRDDFLDICTFLNEKKISFGFNTNTLKLNEDYINKLFQLKFLDNIVISLEGPTKETNDEIRGKSVFDKIDKTLGYIKKINKNKKIIINTVLSKKNYKLVNELMRYCIDKNVTELDLLDLIESGNAIGSGLSLNFEEKLEALKLIATNMKSDLKVVTKFARPLMIKYINRKFSTNLDYTSHGCNAGLSFVYINNMGDIYSCDRVRNEHINNNTINLTSINFNKAWNDKEFSNIFEMLESKNYANIWPCLECEFFKDICFPCPIDMQDTDKVQECAKTMRLTYKLDYRNINFKYGPIRTAYNENSYIIYHVSLDKTFELDEDSYKIFNLLEIGKYKNLDDICLDFESKLKVDDIINFLDYLKDEGVIEVESLC